MPRSWRTFLRWIRSNAERTAKLRSFRSDGRTLWARYPPLYGITNALTLGGCRCLLRRWATNAVVALRGVCRELHAAAGTSDWVYSCCAKGANSNNMWQWDEHECSMGVELSWWRVQ